MAVGNTGKENMRQTLIEPVYCGSYGMPLFDVHVCVLIQWPYYTFVVAFKENVFYFW